MLLCQDRGESSYDPVYEKVLGGLSLVARHAAMPLLDALLAWRKDAESQAQHAGSELVVLRKKVTRVFFVCLSVTQRCVYMQFCICTCCIMTSLIIMEAHGSVVGSGDCVS